MLCVSIFHRAISHMMSSLLYPLVTFVLLVVCVAYWGTTALYPFILCIPVCNVYDCVQAVNHTVHHMPVLLKCFLGDSVIHCVLSFILQSLLQSVLLFN